MCSTSINAETRENPMPISNNYRKQYSDFLVNQARTRKQHAELKNRVDDYTNECSILESKIDSLNEKRDELLRQCALGEVPESDIDNIDISISAAKDHLDRKESMKKIALNEIENGNAGNDEEGKKIFINLCEEEYSNLMIQEMDMKSVSKTLLDAYSRWAYHGGGWDRFLSEVFKQPGDDDLYSAKTSFEQKMIKFEKEAVKGVRA